MGGLYSQTEYCSDEDDMSDIVQLDGCGSLSTVSTPDNESIHSYISTIDNVDSSYSSTIDNVDSSYSITSGNADSSFLSQASILSEESVNLRDQQIPVVTGVTNHRSDVPAPAWHEWHRPRPAGLPAVRQTVRRDNRLLAASQLPSFSAPNCRSLGPRLRNFSEDMLMREVTVALCSETWEKTTNKKYQKEVERLLELKGLGMVSQPRKYRRGGGVCIIADLSKVTIQPIEIPNPHNLEIVFALVKPKNPGVIKEIITFAFYSPPRSKRKSKMTDCIVTTLHSLLTSYPQAGIMGGGDRNCYNVSPVINAIPGLQNLQQLPTLGAKNLDILLSNMGRYYSEVTVVPPVNCDNPNRGVPSDHSVPIIFPLTNATISEPKTYIEV